MSFHNKIWTLFQKIQDSLFPKRCVGCRQKETYLCSNCSAQISIAGRWTERQVLFTTPYHNDLVRRLVWLLKYRGITEIADILAGWIYDTVIEELAEIALYREQGGKVVIVPVPLSKKRQQQRGFNQAEEIGRRLVELDKKLFRLEVNNLVKAKDTPAQVKAARRSDRLANLKGAFALKNRKTLRGRTIILLDDVSTTGATMQEAEKALWRAKPRKIIKVAVAG